MQKVFVCPKCHSITIDSAYEYTKGTICKNCDEIAFLTNATPEDWDEICKEGYVAKQSFIDFEIRRHDEMVKERDAIKCPKCGSTEIQAVTKKWSPLTGFMTNKVDRVCIKCKHKF